MTISPVFRTISVLRMIKAQQSLSKTSLPVHQNGAATILAATNFAPIPTSHKLMGYSPTQLQSIDRSLNQQAPTLDAIGTIVDVLV